MSRTSAAAGTLREAKKRVYLEGSLPKLRTALNHWRHYTAAVARVSFIRPRIGNDPDRFMTEAILRQGFIAERVKNGCPLKTKTPTHHNPFFWGQESDTG